MNRRTPSRSAVPHTELNAGFPDALGNRQEQKHRTIWVLLEHTQTWIVRPATLIALDSAALAAFIGRYEIGPDVVDDVHWENKELVATLSGQRLGGRLLPVSSDALSPDGIAPLILFERDASGRVTGYVQGSPDYGVRRARRIP